MFLDDTSLQPGVDQPHPLPQRRRLDRHRGLQARDPYHDHRAGDPGQQRVLPDREDRQEQRGVPPARSRLREPRRAADGTRCSLRLPTGSRPRRLPHLDPHRRGVRAVRTHRPRDRSVQRLRRQPPAHAARDRQASRSRVQHPDRQHRAGSRRCRPACLGRGSRARRAARLSQRAGHRARSHGNDQLHDRLRHHRRRAGHRARQVQEARRRRHAEDRQRHRARRIAPARLWRDRDRRHHRVHRRERHHRGRADAARGGPRRLRLRVHPAERQAVDHVAGPPPDDGCGTAVHQRRDLQDGQHAQRGDRRGHRARVHRRMEARAQGGRDLPRRQQA